LVLKFIYLGILLEVSIFLLFLTFYPTLLTKFFNILSEKIKTNSESGHLQHVLVQSRLTIDILFYNCKQIHEGMNLNNLQQRKKEQFRIEYYISFTQVDVAFCSVVTRHRSSNQSWTEIFFACKRINVTREGLCERQASNTHHMSCHESASCFSFSEPDQVHRRINRICIVRNHRTTTLSLFHNPSK